MHPTATHAVTNQPPPLAGADLWALNRPLRDALALLAPGLDTAAIAAVGAEAGSAALQQHARLAHAHPPVLHTHDRVGHRIDQVEFHPSWHVLMGRALHHGLHGTPWADGPGGHLARAAAFMLFTEAEPAVLCPVSMTYAVVPALRANPALHRAFGPRLAGRAYDERFVPGHHKAAVTMGMGMTEKQGGSDVRANTTRAEPDGRDDWGERVRLVGHKWFMSAPMCDAFLVLAQESAGGLGCFFVPRFAPDGRVNPIALQRLKHKLGNQANASAEVEFAGTLGWRVGEPGRGVPQILAMGALTRLDCALGTAGLMRQALSLALHHAHARRAFGRPLAAHGAMRAVLADLALESEAATVLALRLAAAVDRTEHATGADHEAALRRLLTPVAKFWVCKRGSHFAQEAMECLGGNGYVEAGGEGVMARIYREMPLNSIWEGAGNIMALDLLRALRGPGAADAIDAELAPVRQAHPALERERAAVLAACNGSSSASREADEAGARALARRVAVLLQAALLRQTAPDAVFDAFCATRLDGAADVFGLLPAAVDAAALVARAWPADAVPQPCP